MANEAIVPPEEQCRTACEAQAVLPIERVLRAVTRLQQDITQAAERGQMELQEALPEFADDMGMQMAVFAHFRSAGYAVHPDPSGGVIRWNLL